MESVVVWQGVEGKCLLFFIQPDPDRTSVPSSSFPVTAVQPNPNQAWNRAFFYRYSSIELFPLRLSYHCGAKRH